MRDKSQTTSLTGTTVAILAGGRGTRLRSVVSDRPKVLAEVRGRPFLTYLLDQVAEAGAREVVLCTGYQAGMVRELLGDSYGALALAYSPEPAPLGTGGAVRRALPLLRSDPVLVMNGDSFVQADLPAFLDWFFRIRRTAAILLTEVADTSRYGRVTPGTEGEILQFTEKGASEGPGLINAGVYLLRTEIIEAIPSDRPFSLETELFPALIGKGLYGHASSGAFIDIGVPESFAKAEDFFDPRPEFSQTHG